MEVSVTITLKEMKELHDIAFYARNASKHDESREGENIEILASKWDDRFHELTK